MSKRLLKKLSALFLLALALGRPAQALPALTVDTTVDEADGDCQLDGDCSLRDAVALIDVNGTITVPAGNYQLSLGEIVIDRSMTLEGAGARTTLLDADASSRIFHLTAPGNSGDIFISGLTLTNGAAPENEGGGVIRLDGSGLYLLDCTLSNSVAEVGGAIASYGVDPASSYLLVNQSTITGNQAFAGGAIFTSSAYFFANNTTISGNSAELAAVYAVDSEVNLLYNTIANNFGGGLDASGFVYLHGNILDQNTPANCLYAEVMSSGETISSDSSCFLVGPGDIFGVASLLLPLANNGGPTDTHELPANSPAVDTATIACGTTDLYRDQRGVLRPQGASCDRGAFELEPLTPSTVCSSETFSTDLGAFNLSSVGDAYQVDAAVVDGKLQLTSDGSALYHATDNGAFLSQSVTGDFRIEVELEGFPVDAGGGYRRTGITVRTANGPSDPRVFVELLPLHPSYGESALMFDYRGLDGVAKELASTKRGLALPIHLAIDRRGDKFTAWYSTDGINWVKPGGAAGGSVTIAMPATVEVGMMSASYDTSVTLTSEFDNFEVCQPNTQELPTLPSAVACVPGQALDIVYLVETGGTATSAFPGGPTNLDAARGAIGEMNDLVEANLPGSRAAVIAYKGGPAPAYATGTGAAVLSPLTTDFDAAESAAAAINVLAINPSTSSTLSRALAAARQLLVAGAQPGSRPVVVVLGDGVVNVDINGNGPLSYKNAEMSAIAIISGLGYRTVGEAGWLGNWNGPISTWDGEALANAMAQGLFLKEKLPEVSVFTIGLHGAGLYRMDLLAFLADYTGGTYSDTTDGVSLSNAVNTTFSSSLSCGAGSL